jgi:hypothetical protein
MTKNCFAIFCFGFGCANVKHHPVIFRYAKNATPPKEGNTAPPPVAFSPPKSPLTPSAVLYNHSAYEKT